MRVAPCWRALASRREQRLPTHQVAGLAPAHLRGRYLGIFGMAFGLAALVGPLLGTQILQHLGEAALWQFCAVAGSASGVGLLLVSGVAQRRTHREESAATPSR